MVPEFPTATKIPCPYVTARRWFDVPEVLEIQVVPSEDVRTVPVKPTVTKVSFS